MSVTVEPLPNKHTEEKQDHAFSDLKSLLSELNMDHKKQSQLKSGTLDSFHSQLIDDMLFERSSDRLKETPDANEKNTTIFGYFTNITKAKLPQKCLKYFSDEAKAEIDNISLYEDEKSQTKTIYRSNSFDDLEDELVVDGKDKDKAHLDSDSIHGFHLEDFSDTFNLENDSDDGDLQKQEELSPSPQKKEKQKSSLEPKAPSECGKVAKTSSTEIADNFPSIGSNGSFQFDDILIGDILGDLDTVENPDSRSGHISSSSSLDLEQARIVNVIIAKLKEQLEPTLERLSQESEKYELIKTVYKLPSVSNLNDEVKIKYNGKGKKFNLDFDKDMIEEMVDKELTKAERRKKQFSQVSMISAQDQIRLNFNKFRQLGTIMEEQDLEKSVEKEEESPAKSLICMTNTYLKSKDTRRVQQLETEELVHLLQKIKEGKLKEMSKVEHLVTMFEEEQQDVVNKLDNQKLKNIILMELNKRKVI
ncbi:hypothetical protein PMKS-004026 [Pichia membranifaciens]|uniref:Uncharacterized protein n=1 Tax=Pichia membranifaciens TaxID=4926 RepID=A0A1Q2YLT6_9ASCO|nr:hypothetical protein PMKS-004026 [Pichia membranifaciens]